MLLRDLRNVTRVANEGLLLLLDAGIFEVSDRFIEFNKERGERLIDLGLQSNWAAIQNEVADYGALNAKDSAMQYINLNRRLGEIKHIWKSLIDKIEDKEDLEEYKSRLNRLFEMSDEMVSKAIDFTYISDNPRRYLGFMEVLIPAESVEEIRAYFHDLDRFVSLLTKESDLPIEYSALTIRVETSENPRMDEVLEYLDFLDFMYKAYAIAKDIDIKNRPLRVSRLEVGSIDIKVEGAAAIIDSLGRLLKEISSTKIENWDKLVDQEIKLVQAVKEKRLTPEGGAAAIARLRNAHKLFWQKKVSVNDVLVEFRDAGEHLLLPEPSEPIRFPELTSMELMKALPAPPSEPARPRKPSPKAKVASKRPTPGTKAPTKKAPKSRKKDA